MFGNETFDILDLGMHAFADSFIPADKLEVSEPVFPLICTLDTQTGYIQNKIKTTASDRYNLYTYSYTSSNSDFARSHWVGYADFVDSILGGSESKIAEIGANDGFLCTELEKHNHKTIAIDSSRIMTDICLANGLQAVNMLFGTDSLAASSLELNFYDCVIANNVLNHANDPLDFLTAIHKILKTDGYFVFEVPYWSQLVESQHFDQIYHEHVSYFTLFSLSNVLKEAKFSILNFQLVDYHGGSLRVVAVKDIGNGKKFQTAKISSQISREKESGLFNPELYEKFQNRIQKKRSQFLDKIHQFKLSSEGIPLVGVGAAAKANTLLTYYGLNNTYIDFITDSSSLKIGKFTPLTRIPIYPDSRFSEIQEALAIVLSWNISATLKKQIANINNKVRFLEL